MTFIPTMMQIGITIGNMTFLYVCTIECNSYDVSKGPWRQWRSLIIAAGHGCIIRSCEARLVASNGGIDDWRRCGLASCFSGCPLLAAVSKVGAFSGHICHVLWQQSSQNLLPQYMTTYDDRTLSIWVRKPAIKIGETV